MMKGGIPILNMAGGIISGFLFCSTIFFLSRSFLHRKSNVFNITPVSLHRISSRVVSAMQGIIACIVGYIITISCQDVINDNYWLGEAYAWFLCTYLYFDTYLGYQEYLLTKEFQKNVPKYCLSNLVSYLRVDLGMTFHHVCLPMLILPIISIVRRGIYFFGCFLFAEVILPFKSFRDIAVELKKTQTLVYLVNAALFVVAFILSRFLVYLYMWNSYAKQVGLSVLSVPGHIPLQCNLGCLTYFLLNVYFLVKVVKQVKIEALEWWPSRQKIKKE